ncbi:hypothetical protein QA601_14895 [Chitinispirillales bacterium ANBcel5]|uniref:hypothetical protein n=1 Tax=Cellulosispirillum alkaliphilum TaxID=3039283 RepID=UPI002A540C9E|nr:hypothetical protein [Chitinispirillales bacterium ANBcel5]
MQKVKGVAILDNAFVITYNKEGFGMKLFFLLLLQILFVIMLNSCNNLSSMSAEELYEAGMNYLQQGELERAHKHFQTAAEKENKAAYNWAAARTTRSRTSALLYAWEAWSGGMKNRELLLFLTSLSRHQDQREKIEYGLKLLEEIEDPGKQDIIRGEIYLNKGHSDSAVTVWNRALQSNPQPALVNAIGRVYMIRGQYDTLHHFLENARESQLLDENGYSLYAFSLCHSARISEAVELFEEALSLDFNKPRLHFNSAWLYLLTSRPDKALQHLDFARRYYVHPNSLLEQNINLLSAVLHRYNQNTKELTKLKGKLCDDSPREGTCHFLQSMLLAASGSKSEEALDKLDSARKQLPRNPVIEYASINEFLMHDTPENALESFELLPVNIQRFPSVIMLQAQILSSSQRPEDALELLYSMHNLGAASRASLELQQDLTFRLGRDEESFILQDILEEAYPQDRGIRFKRALLYLRTNNADSALAIVNELSRDEPENPAILRARFHAYFMNEEYQRVIHTIEKQGIEDAELTVFKARAKLHLGKTTQALNTYTQIAQETKNPYILLECADQLRNAHEYDRAIEIYKRAASEIENHLPESPVLASVFNQLAKAQRSSENVSSKAALQSAHRAYLINAADVSVIDTYASLLSLNDRYRDAVRVLRSHLQNSRNPLLLLRLGKVHRDGGRRRQASRVHSELSEMSDEELATMSIQREQLNQLLD